MTEKERQEIDQELCAEGLHRFLKQYGRQLDHKETAVFYGAISLLYDCHSDEWLSKSTERYDTWNPFDA